MDFVSEQDFFAFIVFVVAFLLFLSLTLLVRRDRLHPRLRPLAAYDAVNQQVAAAVESGGRVHVSLAGNNITDTEAAGGIAGLSTLAAISERSATGKQLVLGTTADATMLPVMRDVVGETAAGQNVSFRATAARLVALDTLTLAAAATGIIPDEEVQANVLLGSFEQEAILITEAGQRRGISQTMGSDRIQGQAVAFVAADHPLIGEEMFVAQAYLKGQPSRLGGVATLDVLRWIVAFAIVAGVVLKTLGIL